MRRQSINDVLKITKGKNSHISIYVFEKNREEIDTMRRMLTSLKFKVECNHLDNDDEYVKTLDMRADNFVGFDFIEIIIYLKGEVK